MRKIKNCMKIGILIFGILLLFTNCEKEDNTPITTTEQQILSKTTKNENVIFSNPDYSNIQLKLNENIKIFNSNNTISFENKFGKPLYKSSIGIDSKFKTLITPMYDDKTTQLKGWLSGFYDDNGEIKFMYSVASENQIEILDLKKGNLVLTDKKKSKIKIKKTNKKYAAKLICGSSYRYICGTVYSGDGHGETSCGYYYEGERCVDVGNEDQESDGEEGGGGDWEDPFAGGGGGSPEPINYESGYYLDEYGVCQPDQIINNLTGKVNCVYEKLIRIGVSDYHNLITDLFIEFGEDNIGNDNIYFEMNAELPDETKGNTVYDVTNNAYIVQINSNTMNSISSLEMATVLVHEIAHAFLGKHYNNSTASFNVLYQQYRNENGLVDYSHDIMKDSFIKRIANVIFNFDNTLFTNYEDYQVIAALGLYEFSLEEKNKFNNAIKIARENDKNCLN